MPVAAFCVWSFIHLSKPLTVTVTETDGFTEPRPLPPSAAGCIPYAHMQDGIGMCTSDNTFSFPSAAGRVVDLSSPCVGNHPIGRRFRVTADAGEEAIFGLVEQRDPPRVRVSRCPA